MNLFSRLREHIFPDWFPSPQQEAVEKWQRAIAYELLRHEADMVQRRQHTEDRAQQDSVKGREDNRGAA